MQVTVYGRQRLGHDVFLGEVVVPLRDIPELLADKAEPRKFTLGRRSTKEKVSGEIHLAMGWRITPQIELIMKASPCKLVCLSEHQFLQALMVTFCHCQVVSCCHCRQSLPAQSWILW